MKHYCLVKPLLPVYYGRKILSTYLRSNLENFFDHNELEMWFQLKKTYISLSKINEIFDLNNEPNLFTIGVVCNPYIRTWLCYCMQYTNDVYENLSVEGLEKFIYEDIYQHPDYYKSYYETLTCENVKINYTLDFENIANDLKNIDILKNRTDTNIFDDYYNLCALHDKFYTTELKNEVQKIFKKDFEYYGYR